MGNLETRDLNRAWYLFTLHGERPIFGDLPKVPPDGSMWAEGKKEKRVQQKVILMYAGHPWLTIQRSVVKFAPFWGLEHTIIAGWQQRLYRPALPGSILGTAFITASCILVMGLTFLGGFLLRLVISDSICL